MGFSEQNELYDQACAGRLRRQGNQEVFLAVSACSVRNNCAPYSEGAANRQLGIVRPPPPQSGYGRLHADDEAFRKN